MDSSRTKTDLDLSESPESYFRGHLLEALDRLRVQINVWTEFYLVDLLARKATTFPIQTPLVLQIKAAVETSQPLARFEHYRSAGDTALLLLGFFGDYVDRRALSRGYVAHMGSGAYRATASMSASFDGLTAAYEDLSDGFMEFTRIINEVRELTSLRTQLNVLRMYEALEKFQSPTLAGRLSREGLAISPGSEDQN